MSRRAEIERNTKETKIKIALELDGTGKAELHSGIGFFDHMLDGFARHGLFDLTVDVDGDLDVDCHHTVEDTGIVLGNAIREAVGDKKGIRRYGSCILPMDEALVLCAVDLSVNFSMRYPTVQPSTCILKYFPAPTAIISAKRCSRLLQRLWMRQ